jgi:hypothetical protein
MGGVITRGIGTSAVERGVVVARGRLVPAGLPHAAQCVECTRADASNVVGGMPRPAPVPDKREPVT